jgi:hypothetical protein
LDEIESSVGVPLLWVGVVEARGSHVAHL